MGKAIPPTLLIDGCNLGLRLVKSAAGRHSLLPSHGSLARGRGDTTLLRTSAVLPTLEQLARAGSGTNVHVIIDGKASGGAFAGSSHVLSQPWRGGMSYGAGGQPGAPAEECMPGMVFVSVTAIDETADERIVAECTRLAGAAGEPGDDHIRVAVGGSTVPLSETLALAMGIRPRAVPGPGAQGSAREGAQSPLQACKPQWWVSLKVRRLAGGSGPMEALGPVGLQSRSARTLVLRPGMPQHEKLAVQCIRAVDPLRWADDIPPTIGPHLLLLERVRVSRTLVLTRDHELAERCFALGALCGRSLADLCLRVHMEPRARAARLVPQPRQGGTHATSSLPPVHS
ncbi:hypothetical protein T492DRAFT_925323 [Pavlovales sp. CCMP2436]|nr:hypothetical protein T492DRAFT_925323 [Pavlovales sp. CCMP2436]